MASVLMKRMRPTSGRKVPDRDAPVGATQRDLLSVRRKSRALNPMSRRIDQRIDLASCPYIPKANSVCRDGENGFAGMKRDSKTASASSFRKRKRHFVFWHTPYLHFIVDAARDEKFSIRRKR